MPIGSAQVRKDAAGISLVRVLVTRGDEDALKAVKERVAEFNGLFDQEFSTRNRGERVIVFSFADNEDAQDFAKEVRAL